LKRDANVTFSKFVRCFDTAPCAVLNFQSIKGGSELLENEINENLGSKREDWFLDPFVTMWPIPPSRTNQPIARLSTLTLAPLCGPAPTGLLPYTQHAETLGYSWHQSNLQIAPHLFETTIVKTPSQTWPGIVTGFDPFGVVSSFEIPRTFPTDLWRHGYSDSMSRPPDCHKWGPLDPHLLHLFFDLVQNIIQLFFRTCFISAIFCKAPQDMRKFRY